jgi:hypothetical protein
MLGSLEYSGSPIAGDFIHARKSSHSAPFSIVIGVLFHRDNNLMDDWFPRRWPKKKMPQPGAFTAGIGKL